MNLTDVRHAVKAHKRHKRAGRGAACGQGKTNGRGSKGLGSRTGANYLRGFIGGQTQLKTRFPKRGFNNAVHATVFVPVNISFLQEKFEDGATVEIATLREKGVGVRRGDLIKILGTGDLSRKLTVRANAFSASAREKIEKAGGAAELIPMEQPAGKVKPAGN